MQRTASNSTPEHHARPGSTSLIRTGAGMLTLQTELVGEPAQLVTIVVFRGRVLERWQSESRVSPNHVDSPKLVHRWHTRLEARVREGLARVARDRMSPSPSQGAPHEV